MPDLLSTHRRGAVWGRAAAVRWSARRASARAAARGQDSPPTLQGPERVADQLGSQEYPATEVHEVGDWGATREPRNPEGSRT